MLLAGRHAGGGTGGRCGATGHWCHWPSLALLAGGQLAVSLANWLATLLAPPHALPRMDFSAGIPPESRALVVIPIMLTSPGNVESLVEALEVRFLANRDANLHFGLLTDFADADEGVLPRMRRCWISPGNGSKP